MNFLVALMLMVGCELAQAEVTIPPEPTNKKWKEECASCHMAFPPKFMNAKSWQRLMLGLEHHFGTNAALDPDDNKEILDFLQSNAAEGTEFFALNHRISGTRYFKNNHSKVPNEAWTIELVKSRANCTACHIAAEKGNWKPVLDDSFFTGHLKY